MSEVVVRDAAARDALAIATIYNHYIERSTATFDIEPRTAEERVAWLAAHDADHPVLVAERDGTVVAWGSLTAWGTRPAYAHSVEISAYVAPDARGAGIGGLLMDALLDRARTSGHHAVIAQIVADNETSLRATERVGFERVGLLREVGFKFGVWLDVVLLEKLL
jgi:phosphinothricin acetyltransferase